MAHGKTRMMNDDTDKKNTSMMLSRGLSVQWENAKSRPCMKMTKVGQRN